MLSWSKPEDDARGYLSAAGHKGIYTIRWVASVGFTLSGNGHDGLPMLSLPPFGRLFGTLDEAKDRAETIEWTQAVESEVSGT